MTASEILDQGGYREWTSSELRELLASHGVPVASSCPRAKLVNKVGTVLTGRWNYCVVRKKGNK